MRTIIAAALTLLASSPGLAQQSLCNPCVDPPNPAVQRDLRDIETLPLRSFDDVFDLGTVVPQLRSLTLDDTRRVPVDEALKSAARELMPPELTQAELSTALDGGLWRRDRAAVAVALPRESETLIYVFVRQADGSYEATDATSVISRAAFGFFGWPAEEYERFEIQPLGWEVRDGGLSLLRTQTRAWRQGQRYTAGDIFFVGADGSISGR